MPYGGEIHGQRRRYRSCRWWTHPSDSCQYEAHQASAGTKTNTESIPTMFDITLDCATAAPHETRRFELEPDGVKILAAASNTKDEPCTDFNCSREPSAEVMRNAPTLVAVV